MSSPPHSAPAPTPAARRGTCPGQPRLALALALALAAAGAAACQKPLTAPSILLVTLDTLRRDHVGAFGGPPQLTPVLDRFAAGGIVHEAAFTTMPTTGPAHVSLFTGLLPDEHGALRNGIPMRAGLAERELAARLRERGYATAAFVSARVLAPDATGLQGFDVFDLPQQALRPGRRTVRRALAWLGAERDGPVFLWVHLYDPHAPYGTWAEKQRSGAAVDPALHGWVKRPRAETPGIRAEMAASYARGVQEADAALGLLLQGAQEQLAAPPLVAVAADHGEALDEQLESRGYAWDHGEFLDEEQVRIPLVLWGPGVEQGRSPGSVSIRDLYATLLAAADVPPAADERGARRDLRRRSRRNARVVVERRSLSETDLHELDAQALAAVRSHSVAVTDGRATLVLAEDGTPTTRTTGAGQELLELARLQLRAWQQGASSPAPTLDPQTREALERLGYVGD